MTKLFEQRNLNPEVLFVLKESERMRVLARKHQFLARRALEFYQMEGNIAGVGNEDGLRGTHLKVWQEFPAFQHVHGAQRVKLESGLFKRKPPPGSISMSEKLGIFMIGTVAMANGLPHRSYFDGFLRWLIVLDEISRFQKCNELRAGPHRIKLVYWNEDPERFGHEDRNFAYR
jgi:hypothetical protein